ncbi:MAG: prepilin peptidase [Candidatus Hydrogenedentes bacterium]|nr:prepilin peptidase [Candidatus Hydrogenedentota bacterium]
MELIQNFSLKDYIFLIFSFLFGSVFGSFCNVCIYRFPIGKSIISPGSHCPKCNNPIAWYDNIPIVSWIILLGKCRHCKAPISFQYPLVEFLSALLFVIIFLRFKYTLATLVYCVFCAGLIIVVFQDLSTWTIPNEVTLLGMPLGVGIGLLGMFFPNQGIRLEGPFEAIDGIALGALIICLLDLIVVLLMRKPGMGFGDVKLLSMLGAFLGWEGVLGSLVIASFIGSIIGLIVMGYYSLFRKKLNEERQKNKDVESNEDTSYPVDPAEAVIVFISGVYLLARILQFYIAYTEKAIIPEEILRGITLVGGGGLLFSIFIAIIAYYVWQKERKGKSIESQEEIEISLESHYIPFGPYLSIGGFLYLLWGPEIVSKYLQVLSL